MQRSTRVLCAAFVLLAILRPAVGEVFLLRSGGRVEGDLVNADENPRTSYVISLPNGGQLTLDAAVVEKVQPVPPELAEYEKVRRQYPDTVQGQLQMADWCREHNLAAQRKTHLERVLQLDPDQADARRTAGLPQGQRQVDDARRRDGRPRQSQTHRRRIRWFGSRSRRRNFRTVKTSNARPKASGSRRSALWRKWLDGNQAEQGAKNLRSINDPMAIFGLAERLKKDPRTDARLIYVEVLGRHQPPRGPRPAGHVCDRRSGGRSPPFLPG